MFTIYDSSDRPIAFSGRQLPGGPEPKYRNFPATEIYKKDQTLYGLNWAKRNFAKEDRIIICEGQLDVIAFMKANSQLQSLFAEQQSLRIILKRLLTTQRI